MNFEGISSLAGLDRAILVIIVSEIGDKTFLIAAILSMRHPRVTVFAGSITALALMSLLSSLLGTILPTLLPKRYTTIAAAGLFFLFGFKMIMEGVAMEGGEKGRELLEEEMREVQKEVEEAEEEVLGRELARGGAAGGGGDSSGFGGPSILMTDLEEGRLEPGGSGSDIDRSGSVTPGGTRRVNVPARRNSISGLAIPSRAAAVTGLKEGAKNLGHLFFSPIFIQAFILTFLAEWGDRSQITTIALAAAHNVWLVTLGTTIGHSFCTLLAVVAGRFISQHISIKHVTLGGAVLFIIFGIIYSYEAWYWDEAAEAAASALRF